MNLLYIITGSVFLISFFANPGKAFMALKIAGKRFINILPAFLLMLILISFALTFFSDKIILKYLNHNNIYAIMRIASVIGSITILPGFIAFPLCRILLKKGVYYMVLSAFSTTLMMVGFLTFPVEKKYFSIKITVIRNVISFIIALLTALITGLFFREIF